MLIKFASYFNSNHHIGKLFSISIMQPANYEEFDRLFPPLDLFYQYKSNKISWNEFKKAYRAALEDRKEEIIESLNDIEEEDITFCCWEKEPHYCHRKIAFEFLQEIGYNVVLK